MSLANLRIGQGLDIHKLVEGRPLILGGINLESTKGLLGHSDADALLHSIIDSFLGATALGDIGKFFPPNNEQWKNAKSSELLKIIYEKIKPSYRIINIDSTLLLEAPKLSPHIEKIRLSIASILNNEINISQISVKAGTAEKMSFIGREEGIFVSTICLLEKIS